MALSPSGTSFASPGCTAHGPGQSPISDMLTDLRHPLQQVSTYLCSTDPQYPLLEAQSSPAPAILYSLWFLCIFPSDP